MAVLKLLCLLFNVQIFCIGVLISAAIALSAINQVEEIADERGDEYEDASDYRAAARGSIAVSSIAIIYHFLMIILRCIYLFSPEEKFLNLYIFIVSITNYTVGYSCVYMQLASILLTICSHN